MSLWPFMLFGKCRPPVAKHGGQPPAPPHTANIRIVNTFDSSLIADHLAGAAGEQIIMHIVRGAK